MGCNLTNPRCRRSKASPTILTRSYRFTSRRSKASPIILTRSCRVTAVAVEVEEVGKGKGKGEEVGLPRKTLQKMLQTETLTQVFTKSGASLLLPAVESTPSTNGCTLLTAPTMTHPLARPTPSTLMACTHA